MSTDDLEARIRGIEGVLSAEMTDTEVVILLADGAKASAIGSLVAHLVSESRPGLVVRMMSFAPAAPQSRGPRELVAWIVAGVSAVAVVALAVALISTGGNDSDTPTAAAASRRSSTTTVRSTTVTTARPTTTTAAPTTTAALTTTTSTTAPPPAFALQRGECRQDDEVLTARGAITNKETTAHSYRIVVRFLDAAGHVAASGTTDVPRVAPREQREWIVQVTYNGNLWANGGTCKASATVVG